MWIFFVVHAQGVLFSALFEACMTSRSQTHFFLAWGAARHGACLFWVLFIAHRFQQWDLMAESLHDGHSLNDEGVSAVPELSSHGLGTRVAALGPSYLCVSWLSGQGPLEIRHSKVRYAHLFGVSKKQKPRWPIKSSVE